MNNSVRIAPSHSLILVMDLSVGAIPETMGGGLVASTASCVAIGTLCEHDGDTAIDLLQPSDRLPHGKLVFDGVLPTPTRRVAVCSVLREPLLGSDVDGDQTRVRIWTNDDAEPDAISILLGPWNHD